jgi:hypothetical protein
MIVRDGSNYLNPLSMMTVSFTCPEPKSYKGFSKEIEHPFSDNRNLMRAEISGQARGRKDINYAVAISCERMTCFERRE